MKYLIFRNHTVEYLFNNLDVNYSGYNDLLCSTADADIIVWFYTAPLKANNKIIVNELNSYIDQIKWLVDNNSNRRIVIFLISQKLLLRWTQTNINIYNAIVSFNSFVRSTCETNILLQYLDFDEFLDQFPKTAILDWKYYLISQSAISPRLAKPFKEWFGRSMQSLNGIRKKCLVLDLDNTLWGGILGEDGIDGIKIGDNYPGLAYKIFQEYLLEASHNGVILAICSKNNISDVEEAWKNHPSMVLTKDHFSSIRINWINKASNIKDIANELNIGLDSIVFIDDNPAEREIVKQILPDVSTPEFPSEPHELPLFFFKIWEEYFKIYKLLEEDKNKVNQYRQNFQRIAKLKEFVDEKDYLLSLEMVLTFVEANNFNIERISQMTQKTNQFNLTTKRYTISDISNYISNNHLVCCMGVKDKFGDNGITLAAIVLIKDNIAEIDSFLLSCRILGRGIEVEFVHLILNLLFDRGITEVKSVFIPTKKNIQTEFFYESVGFTLENSMGNGVKHYSIILNQKFEINKCYTIIK